MKAEYINPFLESATTVFQQMCNISPNRGELNMKEVNLHENNIWIKIGMTGEIQGDVLFGIDKSVALQIISAMMGGVPVESLDEMGRSAISELGNMISGNASTILYAQGVSIDITPPKVIEEHDTGQAKQRALTVPLDLGELGKLDIQVIVL